TARPRPLPPPTDRYERYGHIRKRSAQYDHYDFDDDEQDGGSFDDAIKVESITMPNPARGDNNNTGMSVGVEDISINRANKADGENQEDGEIGELAANKNQDLRCPPHFWTSEDHQFHHRFNPPYHQNHQNHQNQNQNQQHQYPYKSFKNETGNGEFNNNNNQLYQPRPWQTPYRGNHHHHHAVVFHGSNEFRPRGGYRSGHYGGGGFRGRGSYRGRGFYHGRGRGRGHGGYHFSRYHPGANYGTFEEDGGLYTRHGGGGEGDGHDHVEHVINIHMDDHDGDMLDDPSLSSCPQPPPPPLPTPPPLSSSARQGLVTHRHTITTMDHRSPRTSHTTTTSHSHTPSISTASTSTHPHPTTTTTKSPSSSTASFKTAPLTFKASPPPPPPLPTTTKRLHQTRHTSSSSPSEIDNSLASQLETERTYRIKAQKQVRFLTQTLTDLQERHQHSEQNYLNLLAKYRREME
ncbi:hypothetical protein BGX23_008931, partial [Mortierella sp. AD031]